MNKMNTTERKPGARISRRCRALGALAGSALLLLTGCATGMAEKPEELVRFPQWTQVAYVLEGPLTLLAWAALIWALNDGALVRKTVNKIRNIKGGDDS